MGLTFLNQNYVMMTMTGFWSQFNVENMTSTLALQPNTEILVIVLKQHLWKWKAIVSYLPKVTHEMTSCMLFSELRVVHMCTIALNLDQIISNFSHFSVLAGAAWCHLILIIWPILHVYGFSVVWLLWKECQMMLI